jgi:hypothetical protein
MDKEFLKNASCYTAHKARSFTPSYGRKIEEAYRFEHED